MSKKEGRHYAGGAYRDGADGKLDFARGLSPEVDVRYLQYLDSNRLQSNGELRDLDNWKSGIPILDYFSSLDRHHRDTWTHLHGRLGPMPEMTLEDCLCAILFNAKGLLHEVLRERLAKEGQADETA